MDPQMRYYERPRHIHYPCEWRRPIVPPGCRVVRMTFDGKEVSLEAPYTKVDEEKGTCEITVWGRSPRGFLVEFPGELDGDFIHNEFVPVSSLAHLLED